MKKDSGGFDPWALVYPYLPYVPWIILTALVFSLWAGVKLTLSPTLYQATTILKLSDATKPVSAMVSSSGGSAGEAAEVVLQTYVEEARSYNVASRTAEALDVSGVPTLNAMGKAQLADFLSTRVSVKNYKSTSLIQITALGENPKLAADLANLWARSFIDEDLNIVHSGAVALHRFLEEQSGQVLEQMLRSQELLKANSGRSGGKMVEQDLATQVSALEQRIIQLRDEQATLESKYKADHPLVKSHRAELERAIDERNKALAHSGDASWLQIVHEIKALENTSDWLMQKEQETMVSENMSASNIVVVDPATAPYNPSFPKRRATMVKACLEGTLLGLALVWAWLALRRPVQREEDLLQATQAPFLGLIPDHHLEEFLVPPAAYPPGPLTRWGLRKALHPLKAVGFDLGRRWKLSRGRAGASAGPSLASDPRFQGSYFQKSFGELRNRLTGSLLWKPSFCVSIFTPGYQEGRSTANAGLAVALAQSGRKVLLIDANPWNPMLAGLFGAEIPVSAGLGELLDTASHTLPRPVATGIPGLQLLAAKADPARALDWVDSDRLRTQLAEWKRDYDCIVLDPPPLNALSGAQNLIDILDGLVLMAASGRTRHRQLKVSLDLIRGHAVPLLGCLLNRADIRYYSQTHRFFYGYSGLGRRVVDGPKPKSAAVAS